MLELNEKIENLIKPPYLPFLFLKKKPKNCKILCFILNVSLSAIVRSCHTLFIYFILFSN